MHSIEEIIKMNKEAEEETNTTKKQQPQKKKNDITKKVFYPEFNHNENNLIKACGIDPELYNAKLTLIQEKIDAKIKLAKTEEIQLLENIFTPREISMMFIIEKHQFGEVIRVLREEKVTNELLHQELNQLKQQKPHGTISKNQEDLMYS